MEQRDNYYRDLWTRMLGNSRKVEWDFSRRMRKMAVSFSGDPEQAHMQAGDLLCEMLVELGFKNIAKAFRKVISDTSKLEYSYDPKTDTVTIEGIKYAGDLFRSFSDTLPVGAAFKIVHRDDGALTIKRLAAEKGE